MTCSSRTGKSSESQNDRKSSWRSKHSRDSGKEEQGGDREFFIDNHRTALMDATFWRSLQKIVMSVKKAET